MRRAGVAARPRAAADRPGARLAGGRRAGGRGRGGSGRPLPLAGLLEGASPGAAGGRGAAGPGSGSTAESSCRPPRGAATFRSPTASEALWLLERLAPGRGLQHRGRGAACGARWTSAALRRALRGAGGPPSRAAHHVRRGGRRAPAARERRGAGFAVPTPRLERAGDRSAWRAEACRPFDLESGPLLRVRLSALGGTGLLLLAVHHLVADFWSLARAGAGAGGALPPGGARSPRSAGRPSTPTRPLAGGAARRPEGERLWDYWRERLAGEPPVLDLPADRPRPPVPTSRRGAAGPCASPPELAGAAGGAGPRRAGRRSPWSSSRPSRPSSTARPARTTCCVGSPPRAGAAPERGRHRWATSSTRWCCAPASPAIPRSASCWPRRGGRRCGALEHQDCPFPLLAERLQPVRDPAPARPCSRPCSSSRRPAPASPRPRRLRPRRAGGAARVSAAWSWSRVALPERRRPVRPDADRGRGGRRARRRLRVRHGPVRRRDRRRGCSTTSRRSSRAIAADPARAVSRAAAAAAGGAAPDRWWSGATPAAEHRRSPPAPRAVRGAGGADAGGRGPGLRRRAADLRASWRTGPAGWPATCARWGWGRRSGWGSAWSARRAGGRPARRAHGGRRLRAARPAPTRGAAGLHAGGLAARGLLVTGGASAAHAAGGDVAWRRAAPLD